MRAAVKVTGVAKLFAANITADGPAETPRQVRPGPARPALRGLRLPRKGYGAAQRLPAFFKPRPLQRHHHRSRRRLRPQGPEPGATSCRQGEEAWTPWSRSRRPSTPSGPADPRGPAGPLLQRGERRLARWQQLAFQGHFIISVQRRARGPRQQCVQRRREPSTCTARWAHLEPLHPSQDQSIIKESTFPRKGLGDTAFGLPLAGPLGLQSWQRLTLGPRQPQTPQRRCRQGCKASMQSLHQFR